MPRRALERGPFRADLTPDQKARAKRLYNSRRWREEVRPQVLRRFPVCQTCRRRPSRHVHHVERHRGDPRIFWTSPLRALCRDCHTEATWAERGVEPRPDVDIYGRCHERDPNA